MESLEGELQSVIVDKSLEEPTVENERQSSITSFKMTKSVSVLCRICLSAGQPSTFISPCHCKGTMAYVHRGCLEHWLSENGTSCCELCLCDIETENALRHACCQSLVIWAFQTSPKTYFICDFMTFLFVNVVTVLLLFMTIATFQKVMDLTNYEYLRMWAVLLLVVYFVCLIAMYVIATMTLIRSQIQPWYRWWQSKRCLRLKFPNASSLSTINESDRFNQIS